MMNESHRCFDYHETLFVHLRLEGCPMFEEEEEKSWRNSNWYVSAREFWNEYKRHRMGVFGFAVIVFYLVLAVGAPWIATHDPSPSNKVAPAFLAPGWMEVFDPTGVRSGEYIEDVSLEQESLNVIETYGDGGYGPMSIYTGEYVGAEDYVSLTWTHQAGDRPDFILPRVVEGEMPATEDFVYFYQQFEWPFDKMPKDANVTIDFSVTTSGDFHQKQGGLMFKVYAWLIDSSDNWRMIYESYPPYTEIWQSRGVDLNYFDVSAAWGGMVPDEDGMTVDPDNCVKLAVGLAPSFNFLTFSGERPYEHYSGSVNVRVRKLSAVVYGDYYGLLGTTDKGADAFSQLVYGSRISLLIGILATALSTAVGVIVGMAAGYFGGKIDEALMRIVDFLLVIPSLPLMMVLAAFLGPTTWNIILVIAILGWTGTSRLIRSQVLAEKNKAYVESARAIGASDTYIIFRHILPNVTPILFANITLGVVTAILAEAGLAFLGLTDPSEASWGRMLADAKDSGGFSNGAWWVVVFPGLMITAISLAFVFVGHTLDHVMNPRLRER
ncbi:ABC transporter permease [Candidatus Thorarchaeota archaeon]|nr:MAG: ABC transporter permease [Candidatus Thorarchaeota archaeon]